MSTLRSTFLFCIPLFLFEPARFVSCSLLIIPNCDFNMDPIAFIGIDPLFLTNAKLMIGDILQLKQAENTHIELYQLFHHCIKFVEICGLIVAVESNSTSYRYTVDDGTGTIECVVWFDSVKVEIDRPLELGTTVRVSGKISTVRTERQMTVFDFYPTHDPHLEVTHFLQAMQLKKLYQQQVNMPYYLQAHGTEIIQQLNSRENDILPDKDTHLVQELILQTIPTTTFSLASLRDHVEPSALARQMDTDISQTKAEQLILAAFQELVRKGSILSEGKGVYRKVNDEHLANTVIGVVSDMQALNQHRGIRMDYIITKVLETADYSALNRSKSKIIQIVNELVEQSILYATGDREYRLLECS